MKLTILLPVLACATSVQSALTWSLTKVSNPSADQSDAYAKIEAAMRLAVARYDRLGTATKNIRVAYLMPGATSTVCTRGDCASRQASACSRPPEPMIRIFMTA